MEEVQVASTACTHHEKNSNITANLTNEGMKSVAVEASASNEVYTPVKMDYSVYYPSIKAGESGLPPILFLHGLFCSRIMHEHVAKELSEVTRRKVYSVDAPCHGTSPIISEFSISSCKMDLAQFIKDRDIKTKVTLVGHSGGGVIAHIFAMDHPDSVEKIVMIDHLPDYVMEVKTGYSFALELISKQNKILLLLNPKHSLFQAKKNLLSLAERSISETQKAFLKNATTVLTKKSGRFQWSIDLLFILLRVKKHPILQTEAYNGEILLIRATDSPITSDETVADAQKLNPNMKVITYENGGHMLYLEHPRRFVEDVANYLKE